jgi:hypothetical protein
MDGGAGSGGGTAPALRRGAAFAKLILAFALATIAAACTGIQPCAKQGITEACKCEGGGMSVRTCLPERVWDHCACGELPAPAGMDSGVSGTSGRGTGGAGAISGGGGTSGTSAPAGSGGSAGTTAPNADDDAGTEPVVDGGAGSSGAGGASGTGGTGGTGGTAGTTAPMSAAYKSCMDAAECGSGASCESATDPDDPFGMIQACAPPCAQASECPKPEGSYEAMLACVDGHCRLDCTPEFLQADLSCPSGMRCAASDLVGPSYCF